MLLFEPIAAIHATQLRCGRRFGWNRLGLAIENHYSLPTLRNPHMAFMRRKFVFPETRLRRIRVTRSAHPEQTRRRHVRAIFFSEI
jgi:hypothetical protein